MTDKMLFSRMWCPLRAKDTTIGECLGCSYQDGHCPRGPEVKNEYGHLLEASSPLGGERAEVRGKRKEASMDGKCKTKGCDRPVKVKSLQLCGACYFRKLRDEGRIKSRPPAKKAQAKPKRKAAAPKPRRAGKRPTGNYEFFIIHDTKQLIRADRDGLGELFRQKRTLFDNAVVIQGRQVAIELDVRIVEE